MQELINEELIFASGTPKILGFREFIFKIAEFFYANEPILGIAELIWKKLQ